MVLNTTSVEHLMTTALPLACYFALNNKTFDLKLDQKSMFYHLILNSMHLDTVSVGAGTVFEQLPGTDKIHMKISGINADVELNGKIYLGRLIPVTFSKVSMKGMAIDITLESTSTDNVHWKLTDTSSIDYTNMTITTTSKPINWVINHLSKMIKKKIAPAITGAINTEINDINAMVAQEKPYTFDVNLFNLGAPLNLTMTMAPSIMKDSSLIKLNFDGLFDKPEGSNSLYHFEMESHDYFPDIPYTHREQFWIH
jgi:hypothetical protein